MGTITVLPKSYTMCDSSGDMKDTRTHNSPLSFYLYVDTGYLFEYLWDEEKQLSKPPVKQKRSTL